MTITTNTKLATYTSDLLPAEALAQIVNALREANVTTHTAHWTYDGRTYRIADGERADSLHACIVLQNFAQVTLGIRAHGNDSKELTLGNALNKDCLALGLLIDLPGVGLVEPDYVASFESYPVTTSRYKHRPATRQ